MDTNILVVALAYAVVAAYAKLNDIAGYGLFDELIDDSRNRYVAKASVYANNPDKTNEQIHKEWLDQKLQDGWAHGEAIDAEKKLHPLVVDYEHLPVWQKTLDELFRTAVLQAHALIAKLPKPDPILTFGKTMPAQPVVQLLPVGEKPVQYIGLRDTYTDRLYGTNLEFEKNQVRYLPNALANKFLRHKDLFAEPEQLGVGEQGDLLSVTNDPTNDDDTKAKLAEAANNAKQQESDIEKMQDLVQQVNLMDARGLRDFANQHFRVDFAKNKSAKAMRDETLQLIQQFGVQ